MTSPQDALYRAICRHPDDDTPRLVYADVVEEEGDAARAAFIRAQVELARLPEFDPFWAACRRTNPDAIRGWGMAHTLPKLPRGFSWRSFEFHRGFPHKTFVLDLDGFLRRGEKLFAAAPIQTLELDHGSDVGKRMEAFAMCPHLERLHRLEFATTRFGGGAMGLLGLSPHASNLTELSFDGHAIGSEGLEALAASSLFERLTSLELTRNAMPPALLVDALAFYHEIETLRDRLSNPGPGVTGPRLRKLSLAGSKLPAPDAAHLFALPLLHNLESLDLSENPLQVDGVAALAESRVPHGLAVLKLGRTFPGVPGVKALAQTSALSSLRWLELAANRLGPAAIRLLAESPHVRGLRVLNLSDNPVGNAGAAALAASPHLEGLVDLVLDNCDIGEAGARALRTRFGPRVAL